MSDISIPKEQHFFSLMINYIIKNVFSKYEVVYWMWTSISCQKYDRKVTKKVHN